MKKRYTSVFNLYSAIWVLWLKEVFDLNTVAEILKGWITLWSQITFVIMYVAIMIRIINSHAIGHKGITSGIWDFLSQPIRCLVTFFLFTFGSQFSDVSSNAHRSILAALKKPYLGCAGVIFILLGWNPSFWRWRNFFYCKTKDEYRAVIRIK